MPNWTPEQYQEYERKNHRAPSHPQPEPAVRNEPLGEVQREEGNAGCVLIRVTAYRQRLLDSDDPCPKYFVDCLRYSGLIHCDSFAAAQVTTLQRKVARREEERTEIELTLPD